MFASEWTTSIGSSCNGLASLATCDAEVEMAYHKDVRLAGAVLDRAWHVCAFFNSQDEEYRVLLPFIKEGFEQNNRASHIIDPRHRDEHLRRLEQAGIDVAEAERKGQLEVLSWDNAYLKDGYFDQDRQIALIEGQLAAGRTRGFELTRLVAKMQWALENLPGVNQIVEYEARLNQALQKYDDVVCCTYDVTRFSASVILDILRIHPLVLIGEVIHRNAFFTPPDQFLRELSARDEEGGSGRGEAG
jgi:hypothetical protein